MNNKFHYKLGMGIRFLILGVLWIIGGCINSNTTIPTPFEKPSLVHPLTTKVFNTQDLIITTTPMLTLLATSTHTPRIIPTIGPTLTTKERQNYILDILKTNGGCRFPCLWGITPEKSSWDSSRIFLSHFSPLISDEKSGDAVTHWIPLQISIEKQSTDAEIYFVERENQIDLINGEITSDDFDNYVHPYTVKEIITKYGIPSQVEFYLPPGNEKANSNYVGYKFWLFYDQNGMVLEYWNGAQISGADYRICPNQFHYNILGPSATLSEKYGIVWFAFQSPENKRMLVNLAEIEDQDVSKTLSILEASGMSADEFSNLITQDNKPACFNAAIKLWK